MYYLSVLLLIYLIPFLAAEANNGDHKSKTKISMIVEKHMQLARIFDGVHLKLGLLNQNMDPEDVVTQVYNLKSKKALQKVIDLQDLNSRFGALHYLITALSTDILTQDDLAKLALALESIESAKHDIENIKMAIINREQSRFKVGNNWRFAYVLSRTPIRKSLHCMRILEKNSSSYCPYFKSSLVDFEYILTKEFRIEIDDFLNATHDKFQSKSFIFEALKASESIVRRANALANLPILLGKLEDIMIKFSVPKMNISRLKENLESLRTSTQQLGPSIGSSIKLSALFGSLDSVWLKTLLGEKLEEFRKFLSASNFKQFVAQLESSAGSLEILRSEESPEAIQKLIKFLEAVSEFQTISSKVADSIKKVKPKCLIITVPQFHLLDEFVKLYTNFEKLPQNIGKVLKVLPTIEETATAMDILPTIQSLIQEAESPDFMKSKDLGRYKEFLLRLEPLSHDLTMDARTVQLFKHTNLGLEDLRTWLHKISATNDCNISQDDILPLVVASSFISNWDGTKESLNKVLKVMRKGNQLGGSIEKMKTISHGKKPEKKTSKTMSKSFVTITTAVEYLELLNAFYEHLEDLRVISTPYKSIQNSIRKIENEQVKNELEAVWNDFPKVQDQVVTLIERLENLEDSLDLIVENDLEQIAISYNTAAKFKFSEKLDLRKYRTSLEMLNDSTLANVCKAFDNLKHLETVDLSLAHASFKSVPNALSSVKTVFLNSDETELNEYLEVEDSSVGLIVGICIGIFALFALAAAGFYVYKKKGPLIKKIKRMNRKGAKFSMKKTFSKSKKTDKTTEKTDKKDEKKEEKKVDKKKKRKPKENVNVIEF